MDSQLLVVSSSPHIRSPLTVQRVMIDVVLALLPAVAAATYFFGVRALLVIITSALAALLTEAVIMRLRRRPATITDGSALVTGILLAMTLPAGVPPWLPVIGAIVAIALGKQVFGGLGFNTFNPAHIGRAFLLASWPVYMTTWTWPAVRLPWSAVDAVATATPLALWKLEGVKTAYLDLLAGNVGGSLGETSAIALLIGGLYLVWRGLIDWRIPVSYFGTVVVLALITGQDPLFHLLAGGLMIGALFMATDYVTTPVTKRGRVVFGIGCGILTMGIRLYGGYPEGVCYSILIMNAAVPLIERYTKPRRFGEVKARA